VLATGLMAVGCGSPDEEPAATSCAELDCNDDNPCTEDSCNSEAVQCENFPVAIRTECDARGEVGVCVVGQCASLSCEEFDCDDDNPCTVDACLTDVGACAALATPDRIPCEIDGEFGQCAAGVCDLTNPPTGDADLTVDVTGIEVNAVTYVLSCPALPGLSGSFSRFEDRWRAELSLPAGTCDLEVVARDGAGEVLCSGAQPLEILPDTTTVLQLVLVCSV